MAKKYENVEKITTLLDDEQLGGVQKRLVSTEKSLSGILKKLAALEVEKQEREAAEAVARAEQEARLEAEKAAAELLYPELEDIESSFAGLEISFENAINMLQEYCQEKDIPKPEYKTVNDIIFDDNSHEFTVHCILNGKYTEGKGERVKEAKKEAAYKMLDYLGLIQ